MAAGLIHFLFFAQNPSGLSSSLPLVPESLLFDLPLSPSPVSSPPPSSFDEAESVVDFFFATLFSPSLFEELFSLDESFDDDPPPLSDVVDEELDSPPDSPPPESPPDPSPPLPSASFPFL